MNYNIISSCSKGNATVIEDIILIDCGVNFKELSKVYKNIKIVLLTHIHKDHFNKRTIRKLASERPTLRFACCDWLAEEVKKCNVNEKNIDVLKIGKMYNYKIFKVIPIKLYHDVPQCGYRIIFEDFKIIYATDTKTLSGITAKNYDLYLIEANYTKEDIEERIQKKQEQYKYAYEIRAKNNHLSKEETDYFLLKNMGPKSSYVYMHQHVEKGGNDNE